MSFIWYKYHVALSFLTSIATAGCVMAGETNEASQQSPLDAKAYFDQGLTNVDQKQWDEAIKNFSEAIRLSPTNALAYECRGGVFFWKGDFDRAIDDFTIAIKFDPTNADIYLNRSSAYRASDEIDKALADLNETLRLNPTSDLAYKSRAAVHEAKDEFEQALKDWNEGLRLNPRDIRAFTSRGFSFFMTSQFNKAVGDYHQALKMNPHDDVAYNNLAWLRATCPVAAMRNGKEALMDATKACELTDWKKWSWIDTLAAAYAETGDFEQAVKYEQVALSMAGVVKARKEMERCLALYQGHRPNHEGQRE